MAESSREDRSNLSDKCLQALHYLFERLNTLYFSYSLKSCNGNEPFPFTRSYVFVPQFSETLYAYSVYDEKTTAASLLVLLSQAFSILKPDKHCGIRIDRPIHYNPPPSVTTELQDLALKCLLDYMEDYKTHEQSLLAVLLENDSTEAEVCAVLATHLFSKLVPNSEVTVHRSIKRQLKMCPCSCGSSLKIGDTGIGHPYVWHGFPDLLVKQTSVHIQTFSESTSTSSDEEDNDDDTEEDNSEDCMKTKRRKLHDEKLDTFCTFKEKRKSCIYDYRFCSQLASQALTNGFAQQTEMKLKNCLIPSIGCSNDQMLILLYDPDQDICLMRSEALQLIGTRSLYLTAVVELWFILNLHTFGSVLSEEMASKLVKCGFRDFIDKNNVLQFYQTSHVGRKTFPERGLSQNPCFLRSTGRLKFIS